MRTTECLGSHVGRLGSGPFLVTETLHRRGLALPPHEHRSACVHFVLEGVYDETVGGAALRVPPGSFLVKRAGRRHSNGFREGARTLRVELDPEELERAFSREGAAAEVVRSERGTALVAGLRRELDRPDELSPLAVEGLCLELLAALARGRGLPTERGAADVARLCAELLRQRYTRPLGAGALAVELGVHRSTLARRFRATFGCTLAAYVRRLRVEHVCRALERTDAPLGALALDAGFADQAHLTRVFRRETGWTPGAWRARRRG